MELSDKDWIKKEFQLKVGKIIFYIGSIFRIFIEMNKLEKKFNFKFSPCNLIIFFNNKIIFFW